MSRCLAWLTSLSLLLASSVSGQQDSQALLPGKWQGVGVLRGVPYHFCMSIARQNNQFKCVALVYSGLTKDQTIKASKGIRFRRGPFPSAIAASKLYAISLDGNRITLNSVKSKNIYDPPRGKVVWPKDKLSGSVKAPGTIVGKWNEGSFWLMKDEILSKPTPLKLAKGKRHELVCLEGTPHTYVCYLPETYRHTKPTSVLINDSGAGSAGPLSTRMAEEFGWIMVGLTETANNRSAQFNNEVYAAVMFDLRRRFNIEANRFYFCGLSGGGRSAAGAAVYYPEECAGILCIGAGFLHSAREGRYYIPSVNIPAFFLVGKTDINHEEVVGRVHPMEARRGRKTALRIHPGGHDWGRPQDHVEAIKWLYDQWE